MAFIAVDFDGTCVEHKYPEVGKDVPHAVRTLKDLIKQNHDLILWTMRSNIDPDTWPTRTEQVGPYLNDAINWFKKHDIPLYGVQIHPTQGRWTTSRKCYANIYIDDAGFGAPLIQPEIDENESQNRPYLDWLKVREYFELGE